MYILEREITPESCIETYSSDGDQSKLDGVRSSFILRNRFRRIAGNRRLGVLWIALDPIIQSIIYLFVLDVLRAKLNAPSLFIGVTLHRVFAASFNSGIVSIQDFTGGLKSERARTWVLVLPMIQFRIIDTLVSTLGVALILAFFYGVTPLGAFIFLVIALIMSLLAEGTALNLYMVTKKIPDITNVVKHSLRFMFFAGPVLYQMSLMEGLHYKFNEFNPFAYFAETSRYVAGIESVILDLDMRIFSLMILVLLSLSLRGYSQIDRNRWRMSSWT